MQSIIAALDEGNQKRLRADARSLVDEINSRRFGEEDWILCLGKDGHVLERVLQIHGGTDAAAAVFGVGLGEVVIADSLDEPDAAGAVERGGYGPIRFLDPAGVERVATALKALPGEPLPRPDPDGYAPDPRASADAKIGAVSKMLELHGPAPESPEQMAGLAALLESLVGHYVHAAEQGRGALLYLT